MFRSGLPAHSVFLLNNTVAQNRSRLLASSVLVGKKKKKKGKDVTYVNFFFLHMHVYINLLTTFFVLCFQLFFTSFSFHSLQSKLTASDAAVRCHPITERKKKISSFSSLSGTTLLPTEVFLTLPASRFFNFFSSLCLTFFLKTTFLLIFFF